MRLPFRAYRAVSDSLLVGTGGVGPGKMSGPGNGRGRFHLTHPYGLGSTVAREIERKLPEMTVTGPLWEGRMACEGPLKSAPRLLGLRTVDHAHAVVEECVEALAGRREGLLEAAKEASRRERDWSTPLEAWRLIAAKPPSQDPVDAGPSLRFRVTCTRSGKVGRADGTTSDHVAGTSPGCTAIALHRR